MRVTVCGVDELPSGTACTVMSGDLEVAVFNVAGELFAIDNACAHTGGPLAEGVVRDGAVTCPFHWWRFDLRTGRRKGGDHIRQQTYAVEEIDGTIVVDVPEPAVEIGMREMLLRHAAEWNAAHDPPATP